MYQYNGDLPFGIDNSFTFKRIWQLDLQYLGRQAFPHRPMDIHTCPIQIINRLNRDEGGHHWTYNLPSELMHEFGHLRILSKHVTGDEFQIAIKAYDKLRVQYLSDRVRKSYDEAYMAYMFIINTIITNPNSHYGTIHKLLGKYPLNIGLPTYPGSHALELNAAEYTRKFARNTSLTIDNNRLLKWDIPNASNRIKQVTWF